ncbi:transposase [Streptomyces avermitilis]|uniref:transposase n=1 Tax=Streptomyces avermitilis TaxID=33903 RepID=UPI0033D1B58E
MDPHQITRPGGIHTRPTCTRSRSVSLPRMQDRNVLTVSWLLTLKQNAAAFGDVPSDRTVAGSTHLELVRAIMRCGVRPGRWWRSSRSDHVEGGDLGRGKRTRTACGGYICFEDEAGFTRRPPKGRTWGRGGVAPQVTVSGRRSGRLSVAGLIAVRPGSRTRLCHRLRTHPAGKGKRRSMGERDFIALIDGIHQLVKAPIVLVWDRLNTHVSHAIRELITERAWLTVFLLPAYSPDLNSVEWVWAHVKRYRPDTLDGFIAGTGLTLDAPMSP